jgi:hypothetical protein
MGSWYLAMTDNYGTRKDGEEIGISMTGEEAGVRMDGAHASPLQMTRRNEYLD